MNGWFDNSVKKAGFHDFFFVLSVGLRGGLWLLWNHNDLTNKVNIIRYTDRSIVCSMNYDNTIIYIIFVYAPSRDEENDTFWNNLQNYMNTLNGNVIVVGDLNEIENSEEKWGGVAPSNNRFNRLRLFRHNLDLINPPTTGNPFTWRRNRTNVNNTYEKLDRVLINSNLVHVFP